MQVVRSSSRRKALLPLLFSCPRCLGTSRSLYTQFDQPPKSVLLPTTTTRTTTINNRRSINTISPEEVLHFSSLSQTWWNERGDFNVLQRMNKVRIEFLKDRLKLIKRNQNDDISLQDLKDIDGPFPLKGLRVLDVGCGGGLFSERLARLGADTLAIDASEENVKTAIMHASQDPHLNSLLENGKLEYRHAAVEDLNSNNGTTTSSSSDSQINKEEFDIVFAMEVVEHVADPQGFLRCLADIVKPGGQLILSTISRTPLARLVAISLAESPLIRLAPAGSHHYEKFIRPDEIINFFTRELNWPGPTDPFSNNTTTTIPQDGNLNNRTSNHLGKEYKSLRYNMEVRGTTYLPWLGEWKLFNPDDGKGMIQSLAKSCNYFFGARKPL